MTHVAAKQPSYFPPCNYLQHHFLTCTALSLPTPYPTETVGDVKPLSSGAIKYDKALKALNWAAVV